MNYFKKYVKASKDEKFIKILEYNFRINKKWLNYYVFSE